MNVTKENFELLVLSSSVPVLVDFYADWCGPCKMMAPVLEKLDAEANGAYKVYKLNVDEEMELAMQYNVMSIPALLIFKDGKLASTTVGVTPEGELREKLKNA